MFDFTDINPDVQRVIEEACNENKHVCLFISKVSTNPEDYYLYAVLAQHVGRKDYTVWQYNTSTASLFWGNYNIPSLHTALRLLSGKIEEVSEDG